MDTVSISSHAVRQEYWELDRSKTHFTDNQAACVLQSGTSLLSVLTSLFPNRVATERASDELHLSTMSEAICLNIGQQPFSSSLAVVVVTL